MIYQEHAHVSFDKHSMRFCSNFLQMVSKNQCCPQIVVSRHKIRHVQRYYKLYCCMKLVLLSWKSLSDVRTRKWHQWRHLTTTLTAIWPSIGKFRFHIYITGNMSKKKKWRLMEELHAPARKNFPRRRVIVYKWTVTGWYGWDARLHTIQRSLHSHRYRCVE